MLNKDKIYTNPQKIVKPFRFNKKVAEVFDDMINRSVPLYDVLQSLLAELALHYYKPDTVIYDLGCSTGETLLRIARTNQTMLTAIGIDTSLDMLQKAKNKCGHYPNLTFMQENILNLEMQPCSVAIASYVLQFITPTSRVAFLRKIYNSLCPGGILLISEKLDMDNINADIVCLHEKFKQDNFYSELEIKQKREALENVLIPCTLAQNVEMIKESGFSKPHVVFQYLNFCCLLAVKT